MERTTNERKAEEIAKSNGINYKNHSKYEDDMDSTLECYKSALEAMQWKDEQFKGFLFELALKITTPKTDLDKALVSAFPMAGLNTVDDILTSLQNDWYDYQDKGTILNG